MQAVTILLELARVLAGQPQLAALRTDSLLRCNADEDTWTISARFDDGHAVSCASVPLGAPLRCVEEVLVDENALRRVFCQPDSRPVGTPAPSWIAPFSALAKEPFDLYAPSKPGFPTVILRDSDRKLYVGLRTPEGWRITEEAIGEGIFWDDLRVLDTSTITHTRSFGVIATIYDGGSESGMARTELVILDEEDGHLRRRDSQLIGLFHWMVPASERSRCVGCAGSYNARPHVEARLAAVVNADGTLRLTRQLMNLKKLGRVCMAREIAKGRMADDSICPIEEIREVQGNVGAWRYAEGRLVRVAARPQPLDRKHRD